MTTRPLGPPYLNSTGSRAVPNNLPTYIWTGLAKSSYTGVHASREDWEAYYISVCFYNKDGQDRRELL